MIERRACSRPFIHFNIKKAFSLEREKAYMLKFLTINVLDLLISL